MYIFSHIAVEGKIVNSNMNDFFSFPGYLFALLMHYFEMGDVGFGVIVVCTVLVNCISDVTAVFFDSFLKALAGPDYVGEVAIFI